MSEALMVYPADKFTEEVVNTVKKSGMPQNMGIEAPLGASPKLTELQKLMGSSEFAIDEKGTPLYSGHEIDAAK